MARSMPTTNAALEDQQEDYQPTMIELDGKLVNQPMSILLDPRASLSYASPKIIEKCCLQTHKFKNS